MSSLIIRLIGVLQDPIIILSIHADNTVRTVVHLRWGPELSHVPPFDVCHHRFDQGAVADQGDELTRVFEIDVLIAAKALLCNWKKVSAPGTSNLWGSCQKW